MPWPPETEAQDKLVEALFVAEEIHGARKTIDMLEREIRRLRVVSDLRAQRQKLLPAPAPSAPAWSAAAVDKAVDALKFYGEKTNYESTKTGKRTAIAKDGGQMARDTLAALGDDEESA